MSDDTTTETPDEIIELDEYEERDEFPEGWAEQVQNAQQGQFELTLFEAWENVLENAILQSEENLTIMTADGIMRQWPWLAYHDLPSYLTLRVSQLKRALVALQECYPKPPELLFQENVDDFTEHKEAYIEVIVAWTNLCNKFADEWKATPITSKMKGVIHAVTADTTALLIHPHNGLVENLSQLAGFNITEEENEAMLARLVPGETDE